jgi:RES domain-containing protein
MILYRITTKNFANDLSGMGAMMYGGRWNQIGVPMVYTSANLSLATLEIIVNLSSIQINKGMYCCEIDFPDHLPITPLENLPEHWNRFPHITETTVIGSNFFKNEGLCLKVPSAVITSEYNYLLNPNHPNFNEIRVVDTRPMLFDSRLINKMI